MGSTSPRQAVLGRIKTQDEQANKQNSSMAFATAPALGSGWTHQPWTVFGTCKPSKPFLPHADLGSVFSQQEEQPVTPALASAVRLWCTLPCPSFLGSYLNIHWLQGPSCTCFFTSTCHLQPPSQYRLYLPEAEGTWSPEWQLLALPQ